MENEGCVHVNSSNRGSSSGDRELKSEGTQKVSGEVRNEEGGAESQKMQA